MHWFSNGVALLAAIGIIAIGIMYLLQPRVMTFNFGLPLPEEGRNIVWWLAPQRGHATSFQGSSCWP